MQAEPAGVLVSDRGSGRRAVVLIHGFGGDHRAWDAVAAALPPVLRVLACDLPGHGLSLEAEGAGSAKAAARTLLGELKRCGVDEAHLVGHSMGGAVATLMAMAEPERIASLTLLAPGGFGPEINGPLLRRYAQAATREELRACLAAMSGPGATIAGDRLEAMLAMRNRPGQIERLAAIAASITKNGRQGEIPRAALAALSLPVAVVWGTADPVLAFDQTRELPARFRLQAVAGAGHMLIEEAPDAVLEAVFAAIGPAKRRS